MGELIVKHNVIQAKYTSLTKIHLVFILFVFIFKNIFKISFLQCACVGINYLFSIKTFNSKEIIARIEMNMRFKNMQIGSK